MSWWLSAAATWCAGTPGGASFGDVLAALLQVVEVTVPLVGGSYLGWLGLAGVLRGYWVYADRLGSGSGQWGRGSHTARVIAVLLAYLLSGFFFVHLFLEYRSSPAGNPGNKLSYRFREFHRDVHEWIVLTALRKRREELLTKKRNRRDAADRLVVSPKGLLLVSVQFFVGIFIFGFFFASLFPPSYRGPVGASAVVLVILILRSRRSNRRRDATG